MGMVAPRQRIASAYVVIFGNYGDVSRYAQVRGVCRQWVYREAESVEKLLTEKEQDNERLRQQVKKLEQLQATLEGRLAVAVVLDKEKQAGFACVSLAERPTLVGCAQINT